MKENKKLVDLIEMLRSSQKPMWKRVAFFLAKPVRKRPEVNVSKISKHVNENEIALVPGKVLGDGQLEKPLSVAAFSFSNDAKKKIEQAGGKALTIEEVFKKDEKNIRIII